MSASQTEEIEEWLPDPTIRVAHQRTSSASPDELWDAAASLRLDEVPLLGRLIHWRIPGVPRDVSFEQLFREPPFMVLAERPRRVLVSGLVGRIWTLRRDYPHLEDPEEFRAWSRSGTSRVVIATWVEPDGTGAVLHSDARVQALGAQGQIGVAALRPVIRAFESLIGTEVLRMATRRAESGG